MFLKMSSFLVSGVPYSSNFRSAGKKSTTKLRFKSFNKNYDTADFVAGCRERGCTPHVAQNDTNRRSAIDRRTTRHLGYAVSQGKRKRIEECFGWMKTIGTLRKTRHRGRALVEWFFVLTAAAYNLSASPRFWPRRDESVWSADNGTTAGRKTPRSRGHQAGHASCHVGFFSSLLEETDARKCAAVRAMRAIRPGSPSWAKT
jgi:Transposase DDE domain